MKIIKLLILLLFTICNHLTFGQEKIPLLSGTVKVSVENGTFECDLQLTDLELPKDYLIRLNAGMNILNMQVNDPNGSELIYYERDLTDSLQTKETILYYLPFGNGGKKLYPNNIRFRYVGKYPVIKDTISNNMQREDCQPNIAFSFGNLRADGLLSSWFPTIYDPKGDFQYSKVRYDLNIECEDCTTLYVNGCEPIKTNKHRFKSDIPREPLLFLGNYNIQRNKAAYFLNSKFSEEELRNNGKQYEDIYNFLKNYTKIPLKEKMVWIDGGYTAKNAGFAFFNFPTITFVGPHPYDLYTFFKNGETMNIQTIAHELSHYYFGNIKLCNSNLESVINEGFVQFLSFSYIIHSKDKNYIKKHMKEAIKAFEDPDFEFKAMLDFKTSDDTNNRQLYAYYYQMAILFSIEKEIGEEKMQKWIQLLLQGEQAISDKSFLKSTLKDAINNNEKYNHIISNYLTGNETNENMNKLWE